MKLARGFLYIIAFLTFLVIAAFFAMRIFADDLSKIAFVPTAEYTEQKPLEVSAYADPALWFSHPARTEDPSRWQPAYAEADEGEGEPAAELAGAQPESPPPFAVFFIHPTSYLAKDHWNAPLDDAESQQRARLFLQGMASAFNQAAQIWAPRYRQAAFGAFLTRVPEADQAIDAAYRDVELAFDEFIEKARPDAPIVLAGHSQGSVHLLRLLKDRIAGTPLEQRIAAVYAIGWPISIEHDLPSLGLPACTEPDEAGCLISWVSFAEPADPGQMLVIYNESAGFDGQPREGGHILCSNPITGRLGDSAPASANLGTLVPNKELTSAELIPAAVPATCREDGLLIIGDPPKMGQAVLPGNNYHVYDIPLFWANLKQDVARRVRAWRPAR